LDRLGRISGASVDGVEFGAAESEAVERGVLGSRGVNGPLDVLGAQAVISTTAAIRVLGPLDLMVLGRRNRSTGS
jgi:hypothetical protein